MTTQQCPPLAFPQTYAFDIRHRAGRHVILDRTRRRFVVLTPEEWVRQNLVEYLVQELGCPRALTAVETGIAVGGRPCRADIIVHRHDGTPLLLAECKEPGVPLDQAVLDQVADYNRAVGARYLLVTNGLVHHCWRLDSDGRAGRFIDSLPPYQEM